MTKNKSLGYDRYVISDMFPIGILDMDTGDSWPLADEGIFETVCELLNKLNSENFELKQEQEVLHKTTLSDCVKYGKTLKREYENLKKEYEELEKENEMLENKLWNCKNMG